MQDSGTSRDKILTACPLKNVIGIDDEELTTNGSEIIASGCEASLLERLKTLFEAAANWHCDAHKLAKRVDTLAPASTSGSCSSRPAAYDGLNGVRLIIAGLTFRVNQERCRVLS
jgi:hypothetical protein